MGGKHKVANRTKNNARVCILHYFNIFYLNLKNCSLQAVEEVPNF